MQMTKTVRDFVLRTKTRMKHFTFCFEDEFGDNVTNLAVWEVAGEFTRSGGKLFNIDAEQLGVKFTQMRGFDNCHIAIGDGV